MPDLAVRFQGDGSVSMAAATVDDVGTVLASAEREVLAMCTPVDGLGLTRRIVPRGRVRSWVVAANQGGLSLPVEARLLELARSGASVRTVSRIPVDTLVVDRAMAVFPCRRGERGVVVVRLPGVVATAVELFERTWTGGVPFASRYAGDTYGLGARGREVLRGLSAGWADETVAARLGVSVRTVRREVAAIMDWLDARSRFQAGVRAASGGWLSQ